MPTKQETFDTVVRHLHTQGMPAVGPDGSCLYRAPNDCKCAVGCLIPDEDYSKDMEDGAATSPIVSSVLEKYGHSVSLADDLQQVHDELYYWGAGGLNRQGCESLRYVAESHRLSTIVLDELFGSQD